MTPFVDPPANKDFQLPEGSSGPPLLVKIHGGPTAAASTAFSLGIQFWTSRGAHEVGLRPWQKEK